MEIIDILTKDFYKLLVKYNLLEQLIRSELITDIVSKVDLKLDDIKRNQIKQTIIMSEKIQSEESFIEWLNERKITEDKLIDNFAKPLKIDKYCLEKYSHMSESRFLKRKSSLDTITYSLIRVEENFLAQELYLRIDENPSLFGEISAKYSLGHEKTTNGIVGPTSFTQGHPGLMNLLKGSKVGEVNQPCRIDNARVITRVEFLQQAALDEKTKLLLCKEIFEEFLNQSIKEKINKIQIKLKLSN